MGGILSQLVQIKSKADEQALIGAGKGAEMVLSNPDATPEAKEWAIHSLTSLVSQEFDGGKGGCKSSGGGKAGAGGQGKPMGVGNFFKQVLSGLAAPAKAAGNAGQPHQNVQARVQASQQGRPAKMLLTPEEKETLRAKYAQIKADEDAKREYGIEQAKKKADTESQTTAHAGLMEVRDKDAKEMGLVKGTPEYIEWMANGKIEKSVLSPKPAPAAKTPTARDTLLKAYAEKHGKKVEELTGFEQLQAEKEAKQTLATPPKAAAGGGTGSSGGISGSMNDKDLGMLARRSLIEGKNPAFGLSSKNPLRERYQKQLAEIPADEYAQLLEKRAEYKSGQANLTSLTRIQGTMKAAVNGTNLEIDRLKTLSKDIPMSSFAKFNNLQQFMAANLSDDPALARFREALVAARSRYSSMIQNLRGGGSATNQVRTETAEEIINRSMARGALNAAADEMKTGIKNVMDGLNSAVKEGQEAVQKTLSDVGGGGSKGEDKEFNGAKYHRDKPGDPWQLVK